MKKVFAAVCLLLLLLLLALAGLAHAGSFGIFQTALPSNPNLRQENFFGLTGSAWQSFNGNYTPGLGSPSVSTADYYHQDGVAWMHPTDLASAACVAAGASIANGRYLWTSSVDHPGNYNWQDGVLFTLGYSDDPGVLPAVMNPFYRPNYTSTAAPQTASITAKIDNGAGGAGNLLTITAVTGAVSYDNNAAVSGAGVTTAQILTLSSGTAGGVGVYTIGGAAQNVASQTMTITQASYRLYQNPFFVCNPDDLTTPFYVYAEGQGTRVQHEQGVIKSADLITWTTPTPTHIIYTFGSTGSWSSYQRPVRDGVNSWHSTGFQAFYPGANYFGSGKWTSTDGQVWAPAGPSSMFNVCVPSNTTGGTGATPCPDTPAVQTSLAASLDTITIGAQAWTVGRVDTMISSVRTGSQWVGRMPINSTFNVLNSPARVNVSAAYGGSYPGPTYLQETNSYVEDGILHYYGEIGFPTSDSLFGTVNAATYANGGGLWQQGVDYYTEIIDATAAAGAAPVGVKASCASSVSAVNWITGVLPTDTMRLYRGTTAGTQATLVGDFSGGTATDSGMTLNAVTYYKLVYLNGGTEKKNRVVSTYCSTSSASVNAHLTRASANGADMTTCDRTVLDAVDGWLVSNSLSSNLLFGTMTQFCVAKTGSVITKIFDIGTTRLPRGGDYTPSTANTAYSAAAINSKPGWSNSSGIAQGYYGSGRFNNIRRKSQITTFASYQKPGTAIATLLASGTTGAFGSSGSITLKHTSGAPGAASFTLSDATQALIATSNFSGLATDYHSLTGTFDGTTLLAYADAVAGSGVPGLVIPSPSLNPSDALTGQIGSGTSSNVLVSGSERSDYLNGTGYRFIDNQALFNGGAYFVWDKALTGAQVTSFHTLIKTTVYGL